MNQKEFTNIVLMVVIITLAGIAGYFALVRKLEPVTQLPTQYSTEPFMECVECINGKTWNNKPCCTANFEKNCTSKNGVTVWTDLHPAFTVLRGCYQKAPDTGKECISETDCLSGVCDLESAVKSDKCELIKKELTGGSFAGQQFYIATYSCNTAKPGKCAETIKNRVNPGSISPYFRMDNNILIETLEPGPIY